MKFLLWCILTSKSNPQNTFGEQAEVGQFSTHSLFKELQKRAQDRLTRSMGDTEANRMLSCALKGSEFLKVGVASLGCQVYPTGIHTVIVLQIQEHSEKLGSSEEVPTSFFCVCVCVFQPSTFLQVLRKRQPRSWPLKMGTTDSQPTGNEMEIIGRNLPSDPYIHTS
ncbi:hypothetical protein VTO42DRAFT_2390 [Malbranchea cinnamomea]